MKFTLIRSLILPLVWLLAFFIPQSALAALATPTSPYPGSANASIQASVKSGYVTLSWGKVSGASTYKIGIRNLSTNVKNTYTLSQPIISSPSYGVPVSPGTSYRWVVSACNASGSSCSSETIAITFITPSLPSCSISLGKSSLTVGSSTSVTANCSGSPASYSWSVSSSNANKPSGSGSTITFNTIGTYTYYLKATNSVGTSQQVSASVTVSPAKPAMPSNPYPGSNNSSAYIKAENGKITLNWGFVLGAKSYKVGVRDVTTNQRTDYTTSSNSYPVSVIADRKYRWVVSACNSAGCSSETTAIEFTAVTIPSTPTYPIPGSSNSTVMVPVINNAVQLSWGGSTGASTYKIGVRDVAANVRKDYQSSLPSVSVPVIPGKQYRWVVSACNAVGCSQETTAITFTTKTLLTDNELLNKYAPLMCYYKDDKLPVSINEFLKHSILYSTEYPKNLDNGLPNSLKAFGYNFPYNIKATKTTTVYAGAGTTTATKNYTITNQSTLNQNTTPPSTGSYFLDFRNGKNGGFDYNPSYASPLSEYFKIDENISFDPNSITRNAAKTIYGKVTKNSGKTYLQYYFFYLMNDWNLNNWGIGGFHEGDWEGIVIELNENQVPVRMGASAHNTGETRAWDKVNKISDRPVLYIGNGGHPTYFYKGTSGNMTDWLYVDYFDKDDVIIYPKGSSEQGGSINFYADKKPYDILNIDLDAKTKSWLTSNIYWGMDYADSKAKSVSSPGSTLSHDPDRWSNPKKWLDTRKQY